MLICTAHHHQEPLMCSRDHLSHGIIQCYLPPGRGDSPDFTLAFTSTHFTVLQKVESWVDVGTAVRVHNPCPRLHIVVVAVANERPRWASILGPNTPQSSILPLDHCDLNAKFRLNWWWVKSEPDQNWHGDEGPQEHSSPLKNFGVWCILSPTGDAENLG